jgi:hypothetical protein
MFTDEPGFVSHWKLDDISSGSALDSQGINEMPSSGNPTQVAGNIMESGVHFDGVDDCFFMHWASGSGLQGPTAPYPTEVGTTYPAMGVMVRLKLDADAYDAGNEQVIMAKWNDVGNDKEWMFGITESGCLFLQYKRSTGINYCVTSVESGIIAADQWYNIGFCLSPRTSSYFGVQFFVDDDRYLRPTSYAPDAVHPSSRWASGLVHIGAADALREPSGYFKGTMEDMRFFNERSFTYGEWNAFNSGVQPASYRPPINYFNPNLVMHIPNHPYVSGIDDTDQYPHQDQWAVQELINDIWIHTSGSLAYFDHDYFDEIPGPELAGVASGTEFNQTTTTGRRYPSLANTFVPERWWHMTQGYTIGAWVKRLTGNTHGGHVAGWRYSTRTGPWALRYNGVYYGNYCMIENNNYLQMNPTTPATFEVTPTNEWSYVMITADWARGVLRGSQSGITTGPAALSNSGLMGMNPRIGYSSTDEFRLFYHPTNTTTYEFAGGIAEIIAFDSPFNASQMSGFFVESSGILNLATANSGIQGGWTFGLDTNRGSGSLGGYVIVGSPNNGTLGGYTSGVPTYESGMVGGYLRVGTPAEATLGGFMTGKNNWDALIGGYAKTRGEQTATLGAYAVGAEVLPVQSEFYAFFNIVGRDKSEFDAQVATYKALKAEFDAKAIVYIDEEKPGVNIIAPNIPETSGSVPLTVNFEAEASGLDGKHIVLTYWYFSDVPTTSGSNTSASGTYTTSHTFGESGVFSVAFVAVDNQGLVASDRVIINTASGLVVPEITLTATPESGTAPLSVGFSGVVNTAPSPIVESYIQFGDGTFSASTNSIYKLYPVVGCYLPTFRVRDSRGVIVTDTIVVGVNN